MTPPLEPVFPLPLDVYTGEEGLSLLRVLAHRVAVEPMNLVATAIFGVAILHTFFAPRFMAASHRLRMRMEAEQGPDAYSFRVEVLHFLGEVEAVFGIWAMVLFAAMAVAFGPHTVNAYVSRSVDFTEAAFVVVIMAVSATRPILAFTEKLLGGLAWLGRQTPLAWWLATLTVGPLLGSFITEPAAMIICALILGQRLFDLDPSPRLRYGTLGLLFVNVSVGGTLTHFAAPPVLMVASAWNWNLAFMASHFGWKAAAGIVASSVVYALVFRKEFTALAERARTAAPAEGEDREGVPPWVTAVHIATLGLLVWAAHTPPLFIGIFLIFLAFQQATVPHQDPQNLRSPLLVGFFLAGLVIHGTLQQWWISPVLGRLAERPLFFGAMALTAFNDNAAITYLATLVPSFTETLKYAVVAGAVAGGGLTVIANAPNPAGQSALARYFPEGISPLGLFLGALFPTAVMAAAFLLLP
ncbi:MAG: putative Na+/H+ antiporter [Acidithiobacillales bacterium]